MNDISSGNDTIRRLGVLVVSSVITFIGYFFTLKQVGENVYDRYPSTNQLANLLHEVTTNNTFGILVILGAILVGVLLSFVYKYATKNLLILFLLLAVVNFLPLMFVVSSLTIN